MGEATVQQGQCGLAFKDPSSTSATSYGFPSTEPGVKLEHCPGGPNTPLQKERQQKREGQALEVEQSGKPSPGPTGDPNVQELG